MAQDKKPADKPSDSEKLAAVIALLKANGFTLPKELE